MPSKFLVVSHLGELFIYNSYLNLNIRINFSEYELGRPQIRWADKLSGCWHIIFLYFLFGVKIE